MLLINKNELYEIDTAEEQAPMDEVAMQIEALRNSNAELARQAARIRVENAARIQVYEKLIDKILEKMLGHVNR